MNIQQALAAFNNANQEIEAMRARVAAYDKETKDIKAVRQRLSKTEQRMLQAFQAFQNGTVQSAHRTVRRYKKESTINTVLQALQDQSTQSPPWIHYKELAKQMNASGKRTARGLEFDGARVSQALTLLKKEGQVHNNGDGIWRYGKGDRLVDQMPRGSRLSIEEFVEIFEEAGVKIT